MERPAELQLLGVSFRTSPVAVHEALQSDTAHALGLLRELGEEDPTLEVLVFSTGDRSEFYRRTGGGRTGIATLLGTLRRTPPGAASAIGGNAGVVAVTAAGF